MTKDQLSPCPEEAVARALMDAEAATLGRGPIREEEWSALKAEERGHMRYLARAAILAMHQASSPQDGGAPEPCLPCEMADALITTLKAKLAEAVEGLSLINAQPHCSAIIARTVRDLLTTLQFEAASLKPVEQAAQSSLPDHSSHVRNMVPPPVTASDLSEIIRKWLDADDPTHWGSFERALDVALKEGASR